MSLPTRAPHRTISRMGRLPTRFDELFDAHYRALVAYVTRLVDSRETAEDIALDTFVSLHTHPSRWEPDDLARAFLYRAAYNKAMDILRARRTQERFLEHVRDDAESVALGRSMLSASASVEYEELLAALDRVLQSLPVQRRSVATLRLEHGYANREIAQLMGLSVKTVELHVSLALKTIREQLDPLRE